MPEFDNSEKSISLLGAGTESKSRPSDFDRILSERPAISSIDAALAGGVGLTVAGLGGAAKLGFNHFLLDTGLDEGWLERGKLREPVLQNHPPEWFKRGWNSSPAAKVTAELVEDYRKVKLFEEPAKLAASEASQAVKDTSKFYTGREFVFRESTTNYVRNKIETRLPLGVQALGVQEYTVLGSAQKAIAASEAFAADRAVAQAIRTSIANRADNLIWAATPRTMGRSLLQGAGVAAADLAVDYAGMKIATSYGYERDSAVYKFFQPNSLEVALSVGGSFMGKSVPAKIAFGIGGWALGKSANFLY